MFGPREVECMLAAGHLVVVQYPGMQERHTAPHGSCLFASVCLGVQTMGLNTMNQWDAATLRSCVVDWLAKAEERKAIDMWEEL